MIALWRESILPRVGSNFPSAVNAESTVINLPASLPVNFLNALRDGEVLATFPSGMQVTLPSIIATDRVKLAGVRFGASGTHTSRTMMTTELMEVLRVVPVAANRSEYEKAVVDENCLGKSTTSNRRLTYRRMSELYGLNPSLPLFAVLRRLWDLDVAGRPVIALQCALARDPMLRGTSTYILSMPVGSQLLSSEYVASIREHIESTMNDGVLDQVRRNANASWCQTGHLEGRVTKRRKAVGAPFGAVAFALWLGSLEGRVGDDLLASFWMRHFDAPRHAIIEAVLRCKQAGLIFASIGGGVVQIDPTPVFRPLQLEGTEHGAS